MAKRSYTILVLPDVASPARVLHISQTGLAALFFVVAAAILAFGLCLNQYLTLRARVLELKQDRNAMAEQVGRLQGELSNPGDLARRLREVVGPDKSAAQSSFPGQGGADPAHRDVRLDALKRRTDGLVSAVTQDLASLKQGIRSRERGMRELKAYLERKAAIAASTPSILPVRGPVTSGYGYRNSPFTGLRDFHEGLDIAAPYGAPIVATADGIVSFVGPLADYGNVVFVKHGHGFATLYAHNSRSRVRAGQRVHRGDIIAHVGASGRTTGPHVHYGIYVKGAISNPLRFVAITGRVRLAERREASRAS